MKILKVIWHEGFEVLFVLVSSVFSRAALATFVCPAVEYEGSLTPQLTEGEKLLLCGDTTLHGSEYQAWSQIPLAQAALHLKAFLQSRAYLNPVIEIKSQRLFFRPGEKATVAAIEVRGAPSKINLQRRRRNLNVDLTPDHLNDLEMWTLSELLYRGYPCAKVHALANAENDKVLLEVEPGSRQRFGPVFYKPERSEEDFDPGAFKRFFPFTDQDEYNHTLVQVAEDRALTEGIVEQMRFVSACTEDPVKTTSLYVLGPPKLLSYSFMMNTEVWAELQATYRHTRLDRAGSFLDVSSSVSARVQQVSSLYRWFFTMGESKSLRPLFLLRQQSERPFDLKTAQGQLFYLDRWDTKRGFSVSLGVGPEIQWFHIVRGPLEEQSPRSVPLQSEVELRSYAHELYRRNIYEGYRVRLTAGTQDEHSLSDFTAHNLKLESEVLGNLTNDSPPSWMGAWRLTAATTVSPSAEKLPPTYLQYLGGTETLRGFERLQLQGVTGTSLSRLSTSLELRTAHWSETIWPLVFLDAGWFGAESFKVAGPGYYSPGVGLHWKSPIGPVRGTVARGEGPSSIVDGSGQLEQWQIYLSLGERF